MTIGIPRELYYDYYGNLLKKFFEYLNFDVIVSPITNDEIIKLGNENIESDLCLPLKIYIGHIAYLQNKCDYIITLQTNYNCINYSCIYDIINGLFDTNIITFNADEKEIMEFIKIGKILKKSYFEIKESYNRAKIEDDNYKHNLIRKNNYKLNKNKKVLIFGHSYNINDEYIFKPIKDILISKNIDIIYSDLFDKEKIKKETKKILKHFNFNYDIKNIGVIELVKNKIEAILYIKTTTCNIYINEMFLLSKIAEYYNIPIIFISNDNYEKLECELDNLFS